MDLNSIITQLENHALRDTELREASEGMLAAVHCFFDLMKTKQSWSTHELTEISQQCLVPRCQQNLSNILRSPD